MADSLQNVDKAYYGSKTPLEFRGTKEGRKNPPRVPSYQHKGTDSTASSNKYYAEAQPAAVISVKPAKKIMALQIKATETVVSEIITLLQDGATHVQVYSTSTKDLRQAQTAVDMAVGQNILTRPQADGITFVAVAEPNAASFPETAKEPAPAPPAPVEPVITLAKEPVQNVILADVEELMPPPPKPKSNKKSKKKKEEATQEVTENQQESVIAESQEEITEADIAVAFGVVEEGDD